jgi:4-diphosphocytidyl-2-C-methyl-D-erythritol kinase
VRRAPATAKLNLALVVGSRTADGRHELCTVLQRIDLADRIALEPAAALRVSGFAQDTLVRDALTALARRAGVDPRWSVRIAKRIPVAAGLGGGSADAAAALRIANELAGRPLEQEELVRLAADLGSDVPSQLDPLHALVEGTGERIEPVSLPPFVAVLIPDEDGLSTAAVYAELDRIGAPRDQLDPEPLRRLATSPLAKVAASLHNDLEPAALSLRPDLRGRLDALTAAGAFGAAVSGSGPTCFGLFPDRPSAEAAAAELPGAFVAELR